MSLSFDNMAGSIATVSGKLWDTKTVCERANGLNIRLGLARLSFSRFGRGEKQGAFWRDESGESFFFYCECVISLIHECYFSARNNITISTMP